MGRTVTTHGGNAERAGRGRWLWVRTTQQEESLGSECPYRSLLLPSVSCPLFTQPNTKPKDREPVSEVHTSQPPGPERGGKTWQET